jgi:phosphatidylserine/phosphatidylglycerophosphate/cardiolipin synthase-like enzyme
VTFWQEKLLELADRLAPAALADVTTLLEEAGRWLTPDEVLAELERHLAQDLRQGIEGLLGTWRQAHPRRDWGELAAALSAAHLALAHSRSQQELELVWTGPEPRPCHLRLTEPVLFELVEKARKDLLLVSYSVSRMHELGVALLAAVARGVFVTLVLEGWDGPEKAQPRLLEFGDGVAEAVRVLTWPRESRKVEGAPVYASLHAKCAVADGQDALVTSANLSLPAHRTSMELGVHIIGGSLPGQTWVSGM